MLVYKAYKPFRPEVVGSILDGGKDSASYLNSVFDHCQFLAVLLHD